MEPHSRHRLGRAVGRRQREQVSYDPAPVESALIAARPQGGDT